MTTDTSRITFRQPRHATGVRKQQGRVDLDADWNEHVDIAAHLRTTSLTDVIGPAGAPIDDAAFAVSPNGADLVLSAGRFYLGGRMLENDTDTSLFDQPDLPSAGPFIRDTSGDWVAADDAPPGVYVAWLQAREQDRTVIELPDIREIALGGPDTTTRTRMLWQVRLLHAGGPGSTVGCADEPPGWDDLTAPSSGTLVAVAQAPVAAPDDCIIPASAQYRGVNNQHYRVQMLAGGAPGVAEYAWSRDNASIVATWIGRNGDVLTVTRPGQSGSFGFENGGWIELTDDEHEQLGEPGTVVQIDRVDGDEIVIDPTTATDTLAFDDFATNPRIVRWDGIGTTPADGIEVDLELGIRVTFSTAASGDGYRTGDWWTIPARASTHDIEWPDDGATPLASPLAVTPHGPDRLHARLAVVEWDGTTWTLLRDCRPLLPPLADSLVIDHVGGDGQGARPSVSDPSELVPLASPLSVAVSTGGRPVEFARVRFEVVDGAGTVDGSATPVIVETDSAGLASVDWSVDSVDDVQRVEARLLAEDETTRHVPVVFSATLSRATGISYDPSNCAELAGTETVQEAIDRLCATTGDGCATLTLSPGEGWAAALEALPAGEDAIVCLRPGEYATERPVTLADLGNVTLRGGGPGTVIRNARGEVALQFERCASVTVEHLTVRVDAAPFEAVSSLLGAVTCLDCGPVTVRASNLACPAAATRRATALTVRTAGDTVSSAATPRVHVEGCEFVVGHAQTGMLVVNADDTTIERCSFRTPPKPGSLGLSVLLANPKVRAAIVDQLVSGMKIVRDSFGPGVVAPVDTGPFNTGLRVGDWVVRMNSSVPRAEWETYVESEPPSAADLGSAEAVDQYLNRLVDTAREEATRLPSFGDQLEGLRARLGDEGAQILRSPAGTEMVRSLLVSGDISVERQPPTAVVGRGPTGRGRHTITLDVGRAQLRFTSPLTQNQWEAAIGAMPVRAGTTPTAAAAHVRDVAERFLTDETFGKRFAAAFLATLVSRNPAVASDAVRVGGQVVGRVTVTGCSVSDAAEAVHVGTAFRRARGTTMIRSTSVRVSGNDVRLAVPVEVESAPRAVFVGNVERAVVTDNRVSVNAGTAAVGVEIDGALGSQVLVRDNQLLSCRIGVVVRNRAPAPSPALWRIADNIAPGAGPVVVAPAAAQLSNNLG